MKLASLKTGGRDGTLIVTDRSISRFRPVSEIAPTLQYVCENWDETAPELQQIYDELNKDVATGERIAMGLLASPLPRAFQWLDGSAYLSHVERVRKARGAEMPPSFQVDPLMYQGGSDIFLGPWDSINVEDISWGADFEAEVAIITDDVPQGTRSDDAGSHIKLIMLVNDVSLRNLIPAELAKGFGFLHGKPPSAFSPVAVTPDELGNAWTDYKVNLPLRVYLNERLFGDPNAGTDMQFSFSQLIAHAAKTRPLGAGTIIGSGTVSNADLTRGCACLAEKRVLEIIGEGEAKTPFMQFGDRVRIEMLDASNNNVFGSIKQTVQPCRI